MASRYITYEQYIKQEHKIKYLREQGVEFVYKKSRVKLILGGISIIIAVIPNGLGIIFYPLGLALLTSAGVDMYTLIQGYKRKLRVLFPFLRRRARC